VRHWDREVWDLPCEFDSGQVPQPTGLRVRERVIKPRQTFSPVFAPGDCSLDHVGTDDLAPLEPAALA
jgi:hypothetical protein